MSEVIVRTDKNTRRWWFWVLLITFLFVFLYLIRSILLPFVVGAMAAYFLDPAADKLEKKGFSRLTSTLIITISFFTILALAILALTPIVIDQFTALVSHLPQYIDSLQGMVSPYIEQFIERVDNGALEDAKGALGGVSAGAMAMLKGVMAQIFQSGMALVNLVTLFFLTPVVTFYLLRDWDVMMAKFDALLPRSNVETIREQLRKIDDTIAGYLRGQVNVCLILSVFYVVALGAVQLKFFILIGLIGGMLSFIPFVGAMMGFVAAILVAYFQYGDWMHMLVVGAIFGIGQVLEGNILVPKLIGDKVGLHPVWVIFGMLTGAALFGFVGILLAVPVTAVIGVLVRFAAEHYRQSEYYLGDTRKKKAAPRKTAKAK